MGSRARAGQTAAHERHHDVHVRQLPADLQHHDGVHAVQEPGPVAAADQPGVCAVRDAKDEEQDVGGEGGVCAYESGGFSVGDLEG